jgi:V8-like Glu-specific endopeptidase
MRRLVSACAGTALAAGLLCVGVPGALSAAAAGEPAPPSTLPAAGETVTAPARTASGEVVREGATADAVRSFWTPERMRAAKPADLPPADQRVHAGARPGPDGPPASRPPAAAAGPGLAAVNGTRTAGRVFYMGPTGNLGVCSASAVNTPSKRVVITAGHCVHGGRGGTYHRHWSFVPAYHLGTQPLGEFPASSFHAFPEWVSNSDHDKDVAFVVLLNNERGQRLVDVAGGNGIEVNQPLRRHIHNFAYPVLPPYDGERQRYCVGFSRQSDHGVTRIEIDCNFTKGASGSAWLSRYDNNAFHGYANGVTSTRREGINTSPYFDSAVMRLYEAVANRSS